MNDVFDRGRWSSMNKPRISSKEPRLEVKFQNEKIKQAFLSL